MHLTIAARAITALSRRKYGRSVRFKAAIHQLRVCADKVSPDFARKKRQIADRSLRVSAASGERPTKNQ